MKILILCTGNSCRSQMAHGYLASLDPALLVSSAGTKPANRVQANSVLVMSEINIDISDHQPVHVDKYIDESFDFVITVCDGAKEICPVFQGAVKNKLHIGFDDPYEATGSEEQILNEYRRVRDEILIAFKDFYQEKINKTIQ